ncbi:rCG53337, partial [Rattus norvegicus]
MPLRPFFIVFPYLKINRRYGGEDQQITYFECNHEDQRPKPQDPCKIDHLKGSALQSSRRRHFAYCLRRNAWARVMFSHKQKDLCESSALHEKLGPVIYAYNPRTGEAETARSLPTGQP